MTVSPGPGRCEPVDAPIIDRLVDGVYPAMALLAAMQLDLFSGIAGGATTADAVAHAIGGDPTKTRLLLDALVATRLLSKAGGQYELSAEAADHLVARSPWSRIDGHRVLSSLWSASLCTAESVGLGRAAKPLIHDADDPDATVSFLRGLMADAGTLARRALPLLEIRAGTRIIDIGGGSGGAAMALADVAPDVTVTVLELPTTAGATRTLLAEAGFAERIAVIEGDATREVPGTHDLAWVSLVTQTMPPSDAEAVIANAARSVAADGAVHLLNVVVEPSRVAPARAALFNTALLNLYDGGQAHSTADYERWLRAAGLGHIVWTPFNDMVQLVSARRH